MEKVFHTLRSANRLDIQWSIFLNISKRSINLNTILQRNIPSLSGRRRLKQNKKAVIERQRLMENGNDMSDNKQQALKKLDEYIKVLNKIEGHQEGVVDISNRIGRFEKVYKCSCPNHEQHESGNENHKLRIGVQESESIKLDPNKYGKYVVTYVCFAHGQGKNSPCSPSKLSKIFKEKYGLSSNAKIVNPEIEPHIFPRNDESWQDVKGMGKHNKGIFKYTEWSGAIAFIRYKIEEKGEKGFMPICYSRLLRGNEYPDLKGEGGYVGKMLWSPPYPPYKLHQASKMWQKENNKEYKIAYIHEGENKSNVAEKYFPNVWNTTLYNAKNQWKQSYLEVFKNFEEVVVVPDNDFGGESAFKELALELVDMGINAKFVSFPNDFKKEAKQGWDIANAFPKGFSIDDYKQWIEEAKTPIKRIKNDHSNLREDAYAKRWVHLETDKKYHYDRWTREIIHNDNINLWYANDTETKHENTDRRVTNPVRYLHEVGCKVVKGLAYRPINQEYIQEGKYSYVNSYVPYQPIELSDEEYNEELIKPFFHQIDILSNFEKEAKDFFLDKVAYSIQYPEKNIKFSTLIVSDSYGTGKSYLWQCLTSIYGGVDYVVWLRSDDIYHKFRPWMANRSIVIVDEVRIEGNEREKQRQADALKGLITEQTHMIEPKGVNPYQIKNQFTLYMSTNHDTMGIVKKLDERRYFILNCLMTRQEINEQYPKHFDNLVSLSENPQALKHLRHYFKFKHKISDYFKTKGFYEPYKTTAFKNMVKTSQSQLWNNLDELYYSFKKPFSLDIGTTRELYEYFKGEDFNKGTKDWKEATEEVFREYCKNKGKVLNKGEAVPNIDGNDKFKRTRGLYAWRNASYWNEQKPMQWRLHRQGKLFAPEFREKQEELFNDTIVSNNKSNLGNGYETTHKRETRNEYV